MARVAALAAQQVAPPAAAERGEGERIVETLDVIVPTCEGKRIARRCVESVLSATQTRVRFELVVVGDPPDDPNLMRWLREQAARRRVTLLEQPSRDGPASAVGRGLSLHPERDVVVLDGEVEVADDWLDRLFSHASKGRDIGTVAPFASAEGVAGYPRAAGGGPLPEGQTLASLDALFRRANAGVSVPLASTHGPCIYLRRECLNAVGTASAELLVRGPDTGADFSLQAAELGFRHVLAADVFIQRHGRFASMANAGGISGLARGEAAAQRARVTSAEEPSRSSRRRVDLLRLAESPRHLVLFVGHGWGGGIRRHMTDLAAMIGERCNVLILEPAGKTAVRLFWCRPDEDFAAFFSLPEELQALTSMLRTLGLARIHFHHVHGLPRSVLDLPAAVGVPYDCTLHDYYAVCPQYHLVTREGRYCGEPDAAGCAACLAERPSQWGVDIAAWRGTFEELLGGAQRVIAPTLDVSRRIARYFPGVTTMVVPHPETLQPRVEPMVRVVTLGSLSPEKGLRVVAACAADARARRLPLAFRILGPTTEPLVGVLGSTVSIHGEYSDSELPRLVAAENPDVIWFPAQVPETYSYTLSVAMAIGLPIVASSLGAFPERLAGYPRAFIVPWDATAETWNETLRSAARPEPSNTTQTMLAGFATS
jgi:glycosyltransferase involved in cell wall biosynthesis/GT2 family glycosyltransferase